MGKNPAFQFYPADWTKDPELRRCSHAAKGVWIDMLCLMWECGERGVLATGGSVWSDEEIALAVGGRLDVTLTAIQELAKLGVAKRNSAGAIYCARMVRDEQTRKQTKVRVERHRSNGDVTPKKRKRNAPSSSSSSTPTSESPNGDSKTPLPPGGELVHSELQREEMALELEFVAEWNRVGGCVPTKGAALTEGRRKHFRVRSRDPAWNWKAALAKFPLKLTIGNPDGWKPDMDWFLKPDSVQKILEGKYDWSKSNGTQPVQRVGLGQQFDPDARSKDPNYGLFT